MVETRTYKYSPDYAVHPGEILEETLEARNMKRVDLAVRCGLSPKTVSQIVSGIAPITPETAIQLERVLGISANIWSNLDTNYRLFQAKLAARKKLSESKEWLEKFPIKQLIQKKIIQHKTDSAEMMQQLLDFFGVGSVSAWENWSSQLQVAYRRSPSFKSSAESVATWLRIGELRAEKVDCVPYNKLKFKKALPEIRKLTRENSEVFEPRVKQLCTESGVALVFIPELSGMHLSGAARWPDNHKALIMLSLRYKSDDHLWFSFFHEAGHVLHHDSKKSIFLDEQAKQNIELNDEEAWANQFATDILIPTEMYNSFVSEERYTSAAVRSFAQRVGISAGIVVGRLQHDGYVPYNSLNHLKHRFVFVEKND